MMVEKLADVLCVVSLLCGSLCIKGWAPNYANSKDLSPRSGQTEAGFYCRGLFEATTRGMVKV